jgi:hypothetical protein
MAEGVGFEPTVPLRARRFSRPFPSTTRTPFQYDVPADNGVIIPDTGVLTKGGSGLGEDNSLDARRPGGPECFGGSLQGCSGGDDIIYK